MTKDNMMDIEDDEGFVYLLIGSINPKYRNKSDNTIVLKVFSDFTLATEAKGIAQSVKPNFYSHFYIDTKKVSTSFEGQDELELINMVKDC